MSGDLEARLLNAHARGDRAALIGLYTEAADAATSQDATCFYLTHAYVHALETGSEAARSLHARLKAAGREE